MVRSGLNIAVDITMTVGALQRRSRSSAIRRCSKCPRPVRAVNISGELQRALPLSSRKDFTDFLEVTPGVTARTFDQGLGRPGVHAARV